MTGPEEVIVHDPSGELCQTFAEWLDQQMVKAIHYARGVAIDDAIRGDGTGRPLGVLQPHDVIDTAGAALADPGWPRPDPPVLLPEWATQRRPV